MNDEFLGLNDPIGSESTSDSDNMEDSSEESVDSSENVIYGRDDDEVWYFFPIMEAFVVAILLLLLIYGEDPYIRAYEGKGLVFTVITTAIFYPVFFYINNKKEYFLKKKRKTERKQREEYIKENPKEKFGQKYIDNIDEYIKEALVKLNHARNGYESDGYTDLDPRIKRLTIRNLEKSYEYHLSNKNEMYELGLLELPDELDELV